MVLLAGAVQLCRRSLIGLGLVFGLVASGMGGERGGALLAPAISLAIQDDSNAQHLAIVEDELAGQRREIQLAVETGALRLELVLEGAEGVGMVLFNPTGGQVKLDEPNIVVSNATGRRSILLWDPRPGAWKVQLEGQGAFRFRAISQGDLFVCCAQIFTLNQVFALERSRLVPGSYQQVQIFASGYAIDSLDVQMIDQQGRQVAPVRFRQNDPSNISGFILLLEVPARPFRLMVEGRDLSGKPFRRVLAPLFSPVPGPGEGDQLAPNPQAIEDLRRSTTSGPRQVIRTHIVSWSDEPLLTANGNQIGMRIRFNATFPVAASYTPYPSLYPDRIGQGYTGALNLRVLRSSVTPQPTGMNGSVWTLNVRASFEAGREYSFVIDLVPSYALTTGNDEKFCLNYRPYSQPDLVNRFEKEISSRRRQRFRFSVSGSDFEARVTALTEQSYVPEVWRLGLQREGATECRF